jgi:hypothetical protein
MTTPPFSKGGSAHKLEHYFHLANVVRRACTPTIQQNLGEGGWIKLV